MWKLRPVGERVPLPHSPLRAFAEEGQTAAQCRSRIEREFRAQYRAHWYGSGTSALAAAVMVAIERSGVGVHAEVIVPAYACPDVISAVRFAGATPVLADLLPDLAWLDPRSVLNVMTRNTVAVLYVRFLGLPANDRALRAALQDGGPMLIEDAAHVFPLEPHVHSSADLVVLSFGRGKPVSLRRGGLLLQRRVPSLEHVRPPRPKPWPQWPGAHLCYWLECMLHNAGIRPLPYWLLTRIGQVRADAIRYRDLPMLSSLAPGLEPLLLRAIAWHRRAGLWRQQFVATLLQDIDDPLFDVARYSNTCSTAECSSMFGHEDRLWRYPLLLPCEADRDRLFTELWRRGLGPSRMYRHLLSEMAPTSTYVRMSATPNARAFAQRLLTLPLHSDVTLHHYQAIRVHLGAFIDTKKVRFPDESVPLHGSTH